MSDTRAQLFHTATASLIHEELNDISSAHWNVASGSNKEWAVSERSAWESSANSGSFQWVGSFHLAQLPTVNRTAFKFLTSRYSSLSNYGFIYIFRDNYLNTFGCALVNKKECSGPLPVIFASYSTFTKNTRFKEPVRSTSSLAPISCKDSSVWVCSFPRNVHFMYTYFSLGWNGKKV